MASFGGGNAAFTPSTTADNWTLNMNTVGAIGTIESISWGGNLNTATSYRTVWTRPTANGVTAVTQTPVQGNPGAAPLSQLVTGWTTQPTLPAEPAGLLNMTWNAFGGVGLMTFPVYGSWLVAGSATAGSAQISCRNRLGTDANGSSYGVNWRE
jgi:hypothetical protein